MPHKSYYYGNNHNDDDDVVIVAAVRTPLIRAGNAKKDGQFSAISPAELLQTVLEATIQQVHQQQKGATIDTSNNDNGNTFSPSDVQDLCIGNVLMASSNYVTLRMAAIAAGLSPETCSMSMVNRQCASGLQAISNIANRIIANEIDIGIGAGVESMSMFPMSSMQLSNNAIQWSSVQSNQQAMDCLLPMGITSDTVAIRFHQKYAPNNKTNDLKLDLDRTTLDNFAVESHRRAYEAQINGIFDTEICPVRKTIRHDDGIRKNTSIDVLSKLKPIFTPRTGVTTAGNSSQLTDGAAAVLLMRRSCAVQRHIPILAKWCGYTCCGVPPSIMGIGPSIAIPQLLHRLQLSKDDIDCYELNEAFATQALYCIQALQLDTSKVNVYGGAIALGHPLGATGARMIVTLINALERLHRNKTDVGVRSGTSTKKYGCASMCVGTGMGAAAVIEVESTISAASTTRSMYHIAAKRSSSL